MADKRYYWLKLKEDFFQDEAIEWLEEQENGKEYCLFYLKLCLKSLKDDGKLIRTVGNLLIPYSTEKLAEATRTKADTVMVAMQVLQRIGLVEILDDGAIKMLKLQDMVGSESTAAIRKRRSRENKKLDSVTLSQLCPSDVPQKVTTEIRDKSIENRESESAHAYGRYQNVFLTDGELADLQASFPTVWGQYIEKLSEYMASTGKRYQSHAATIRRWAGEDAKKAAPPTRNRDYSVKEDETV